MNDETIEKTTRSRGRPAYAEKAPRELRDDFALEIMKGVLASGRDIVDPATLSRHCYKIADSLCKIREE